MPNAKREAPGENARKRSWRRTAAVSACIGSRRFSGSVALTSPCPIWCGPSGVLSTKKSEVGVRVPLLRAVQRSILRNRLPLKKQSQRPRSRTRCLNNPAPESRRRNLRSNCGLRPTWPREARRYRGHWSWLLRQKPLSEGDLLQRRRLKPSRERRARKLGRKNWRKKGGGRDGWGIKCRHPVRGEGRRGGLRLGVDKLAAKWFRPLADAPQLRNPSLKVRWSCASLRKNKRFVHPYHRDMSSHF
jgi:hypothetical protein